jgi:hypothetical protein
METRETPVTPSFLGFVKRADCPVCGTPLTKDLGLSDVLCSKCGEYLRFGDKTLKRLEPDAVALAPAFAAPLPWTDMQCPTFAALSHPLAALDELIRTKNEGVRVVEARWPEGCCVCGKPAARRETISRQVGYAPPNGLKTRQLKEALVVARGVPHCADHKEGARFERVISFGDGGGMTLGLFFRSYAYQIKFRALNPWTWR